MSQNQIPKKNIWEQFNMGKNFRFKINFTVQIFQVFLKKS
ncbi:unnamed protein product [Paramecium octaurelia]|uniref:Uncharacterized protein n=1 Tax=Paramecium octaurelia TaxID=43137 RepID=A0A8S1S3C6_PAROT|nr:unnamed protein product [Paramecium octaurelia]